MTEKELRSYFGIFLLYNTMIIIIELLSSTNFYYAYLHEDIAQLIGTHIGGVIAQMRSNKYVFFLEH